MKSYNCVMKFYAWDGARSRRAYGLIRPFGGIEIIHVSTIPQGLMQIGEKDRENKSRKGRETEAMYNRYGPADHHCAGICNQR